MKDIWYADNRDLVKWSVLVKLAQIHQAERILQVAYFRPSEFSNIEIDGQQYQLPKEVISQFRDVRNIMGMNAGVLVDVFDKEFEDRKVYQKAVNEYISSYRKEKCIIFLDPDTGLQPRKPGLKHVLNTEVKEIWASIKKGDVLVFYQHQTNRNGTPWVEEKRKQLSEAIQIFVRQVKVAHSQSIARDVVFFYIVKT
jgi:hypothetical protein